VHVKIYTKNQNVAISARFTGKRSGKKWKTSKCCFASKGILAEVR
jgi:hypothetical protein